MTSMSLWFVFLRVNFSAAPLWVNSSFLPEQNISSSRLAHSTDAPWGLNMLWSSRNNPHVAYMLEIYSPPAGNCYMVTVIFAVCLGWVFAAHRSKKINILSYKSWPASPSCALCALGDGTYRFVGLCMCVPLFVWRRLEANQRKFKPLSFQALPRSMTGLKDMRFAHNISVGCYFYFASLVVYLLTYNSAR